MNPKDYLRASDGNGEAVRAIVVEERQIGDMLINVDSVLNWPHKGIATSGMVDIDTGLFDPATVAVFYYTLSGSMIHIDQFASGYDDVGNQQYESITLKPTTPWANAVADAAEQPSLPPGGTTGQLLAKESDTDGDADWIDPPSTAGSAWEPNETPTGAIDGSNTTFTTAAVYSAGSLEVYLNGQRLRAGAGNDYIESVGGFTMQYAPETGDVLLVDYLVADTSDIEGTNSIVAMQLAVGTVDSSNTVFSVAEGKYAGGSLEVAINGLLQQPGVDFIETSPAGGTFTMAIAPLTGDIVTAAYHLASVATGNADTLDGFHASQVPSANSVPVLDSTGRVPIEASPQQSVIVLRHTATASLTNATWVPIPMQTEVIKRGTAMTHAANSANIVIVEDGEYDIAAVMRLASAASGRFFHTITKNSDVAAAIAAANVPNNGGSGVVLNVAAMNVPLVAGDTIQVHCYQDSGGTLSTQVLNPVAAHSFSARRVA